MSSVVTFARHFLEQDRQLHEATGEFSYVLCDLALAARLFARAVN